MQTREILLLLVVSVLCACESPTTISGAARVVDGDSLEIGTTSVRLHAVDAPEGRQACTRNSGAWRCGAAAASKLEQLVGTRTIVCEQTDIDAYGRTVARCSNGEVDLGAEMVRAGLALAYRRYGSDYVREESQAKAAGVGMWAGEFMAPWDWRADPQPGRPSIEAGSSALDACLIKGNINRRGDRIYHVPASRSYSETIIDTSRGERWFCSEEQALTAGWRAPQGH